MTRFAKLSLVTAAATAAGVLAAVPASARVPAHLGIHHGLMPLAGTESAPTSVTANLAYSGGPVVSNADVTSVEWGSTGPYGDFSGFFGGVLRSPYISWLREYDPANQVNGNGQHIGYGTFHSAVTITPPTSATTVDDSTIQATLLAKVSDHTLPAPTADADGNVNTIYAVFFPHGATVTVGTDASGVTFCAYHGATSSTYAGKHLLYMVLPDPTTGGMASGCGAHPAAIDNLESYTAHELIETITDPLVSLAGPTDAPPLAWYDDAHGEIADICDVGSNPDGTVTGGDGNAYTVQQGWSNALGCIVQRTATAPSAPTNLAATVEAGGHVHLTWSPPADDGYAPVLHYDVYRLTPGNPAVLVTQTGNTQQFTDTPGSDGTYDYVVSAETAAGEGPSSEASEAFVDATKPTVSMSAPSSLFSLASSATTKYAGSDAGSGVASYDVSYTLAKWDGGFGSPVKPSGWQHTTATHESTSVALGHEYCFTAVARDGAGNVSPPSTRHCQVAPLDERSLSRSAHWTTTSSSAAYRHTLTSTTTKGATLTLKGVRAHRLALVLQSCATCGRVKIYVGKTLIATVDTHSASTKNKVIKILSSFSLRTADVRIVAADAGKRVVVDGLGVSLT